MKKVIKYKNREEWLQNRSKGIGASEAGTVLGLNPWELWFDVGIKRYTTRKPPDFVLLCCGLM